MPTGWRVKRNDFPKVLRAMPREIDKGLEAAADDLATTLRPLIWFDTGVLKSTISNRERGIRHIEVVVGWNTGAGFYAAYQEFGTRHQAPRPIVGPTAHIFEPQLRQWMTIHVRRACRQ